MATFSKFSNSVPSNERTTTISDVDAGDRIDIVSILGRPARQIKIVPDDDTDQITFKLNNYIKLPVYNKAEFGYQPPETVKVWSAAPHFTVFSVTGEAEYLSEEELTISSVEIVDVTYGDGGTSISIVAW